MNNIAIYREQFQSAIKEITNSGGVVQKIFHNAIYFNQNKTDYIFIPEMTDGGPMFFKKAAKDLVA